MTNDDIDAIWDSLEWADLDMVGFQRALRHRFAKAVRRQALTEASTLCGEAVHRAVQAGLQQHADAAAQLRQTIEALAKE
jgi:hypothetical protein